MNNVYVVAWRHQGPAKIGVSWDPAGRIGMLQGGNPYRLRVYYATVIKDEEVARVIEKEVLTKFIRKRLCGEWVDIRPRDLIATLKTIVRAHGGEPVAWAPDPDIKARRDRRLQEEERDHYDKRKALALRELQDNRDDTFQQAKVYVALPVVQE